MQNVDDTSPLHSNITQSKVNSETDIFGKPFEPLTIDMTDVIEAPISSRSLSSCAPSRQYSTEQKHPFIIGDRVLIPKRNLTGYLAYIGPTHFTKGDMAGIVLDSEEGKHDGQLKGIRYFQSPPYRGIFCRIDKLKKLEYDDRSPNSRIRPQSHWTPRAVGFEDRCYEIPRSPGCTRSHSTQAPAYPVESVVGPIATAVEAPIRRSKSERPRGKRPQWRPPGSHDLQSPGLISEAELRKLHEMEGIHTPISPSYALSPGSVRSRPDERHHFVYPPMRSSSLRTPRSHRQKADDRIESQKSKESVMNGWTSCRDLDRVSPTTRSDQFSDGAEIVLIGAQDRLVELQSHLIEVYRAKMQLLKQLEDQRKYYNELLEIYNAKSKKNEVGQNQYLENSRLKAIKDELEKEYARTKRVLDELKLLEKKLQSSGRKLEEDATFQNFRHQEPVITEKSTKSRPPPLSLLTTSNQNVNGLGQYVTHRNAADEKTELKKLQSGTRNGVKCDEQRLKQLTKFNKILRSNVAYIANIVEKNDRDKQKVQAYNIRIQSLVQCENQLHTLCQTLNDQIHLRTTALQMSQKESDHSSRLWADERSALLITNKDLPSKLSDPLYTDLIVFKKNDYSDERETLHNGLPQPSRKDVTLNHPLFKTLCQEIRRLQERSALLQKAWEILKGKNLDAKTYKVLRALILRKPGNGICKDVVENMIQNTRNILRTAVSIESSIDLEQYPDGFEIQTDALVKSKSLNGAPKLYGAVVVDRRERTNNNGKPFGPQLGLHPVSMDVDSVSESSIAECNEEEQTK